MPLETEIRLRCDQCQEASEWFDGAIFNRQAMIAELRAAGWLRSNGGRLFTPGTYCPTCNPNRSAKDTK